MGCYLWLGYLSSYDRTIKCEHFLRDEALASFRKWSDKEDKIEY